MVIKKNPKTIKGEQKMKYQKTINVDAMKFNRLNHSCVKNGPIDSWPDWYLKAWEDGIVYSGGQNITIISILGNPIVIHHGDYIVRYENSTLKHYTPTEFHKEFILNENKDTLADIESFAKTEAHRVAKRCQMNVSDREFLLAMLVKVSEEVGELADCVLAHSGLQRIEKLDNYDIVSTKKEISDVIITAWVLGKTLDIDVGSAVLEKIEIIKQRNY